MSRSKRVRTVECWTAGSVRGSWGEDFLCLININKSLATCTCMVMPSMQHKD